MTSGEGKKEGLVVIAIMKHLNYETLMQVLKQQSKNRTCINSKKCQVELNSAPWCLDLETLLRGAWTWKLCPVVSGPGNSAPWCLDLETLPRGAWTWTRTGRHTLRKRRCDQNTAQQQQARHLHSAVMPLDSEESSSQTEFIVTMPPDQPAIWGARVTNQGSVILCC